MQYFMEMSAKKNCNKPEASLTRLGKEIKQLIHINFCTKHCQPPTKISRITTTYLCPKD
jgi:hypothetical protein